MDGILDSVMSDDLFKQGEQSGGQLPGETGGDPVGEAFQYPKMAAELGIEEKK